MGGFNIKEPLTPRLRKAVQLLYECGYDSASDDVEEAIAVLEGRLVLADDGTLRLPDREAEGRE